MNVNIVIPLALLGSYVAAMIWFRRGATQRLQPMQIAGRRPNGGAQPLNDTPVLWSANILVNHAHHHHNSGGHHSSHDGWTSHHGSYGGHDTGSGGHGGGFSGHHG